jgi:hypothetical protein
MLSQVPDEHSDCLPLLIPFIRNHERFDKSSILSPVFLSPVFSFQFTPNLDLFGAATMCFGASAFAAQIRKSRSHSYFALAV